MWVEIIGAAVWLASFVYYRVREQEELDRKTSRPSDIKLPRIVEGAPVPVIMGRCRVRQSVLEWYGNPVFVSNRHTCNLFFVCGIGMDDGKGTNRVHGMWAGDDKFSWTFGPGPDPTGDGGFETLIQADFINPNGEAVGGQVEFLNGSENVVVVDDAGAAQTHAGQVKLNVGWPGIYIPSYRGYISVALWSSGLGQWIIGTGGLPAYSFEVSSYPGVGNPLAGTTFGVVGPDLNPISALWDLLKCKFGKMGIPTSVLDGTSFANCGLTLHSESHGCSRVIESEANAGEYIDEILRQIDGTLRWNMATQKIELKLIRPDYDPDEIFHITKDNCYQLKGFAIGGRTNAINRVRVVYTDRESDYQDNSEMARNPASGFEQQDEHVINMPGVTNKFLAARIAARELAASSGSLIKCTAICDRSALRLMPGDPVKLTWQNPDVSGLIFRVGRVQRGTLEDGAIALDLIQDFFYTFRGSFPDKVDFGHPALDDPSKFNELNEP